TSSPACASGSAATPPTAPRPMITTSVFGRSLGIVPTLVIDARARGPLAGEHRVVVGGLVRGRRPSTEPLVVRGHRNAHARIADEVPSGEVHIAAVVRVAERALNRVREHQAEEGGGAWREARAYVALEVAQHRVLIRG